MIENWESKYCLLLYHPVLIFLSYSNKNTINSVAWVTSICFLKFWRLKSLRSWCQQIWCLVYKYLSFGYIFTGQKGEGSSLGSFFIKALIPFKRAPPSWPNNLPETPPPPPPNTITLAIRFQLMGLGDIKNWVYSILWCPFTALLLLGPSRELG